MCGICGAVGIDSPATLGEMSARLAHRGPDSRGTHHDDGVMLANRRLSIIDVAGGDQPIYNEDGDVVTVYNGEIYNFQALRSDLATAGHEFTTDSDTEVLVHGYEEYGTGIFERLDGMFAAAIYDADERRLLLARDRVGVKPLYYAVEDGTLLFASEPKGILGSGRVDPAVDRDALGYFLQLRYSPSHTTLFEGIETVMPGTYLEVRPDGDGDWAFQRHRFWDPSDLPEDPPADPASAVRETLRGAVDRQLVSDVPVGFYLSGGLDTSSVVAMAAAASEDPIRTFCMSFADSRWDESEDARAVAEHFGTDHHEIRIDGEFMADFPAMIWHADEPKRNLYPYYVAREMRDHVTVALGGLGADELFGGYVYRFDRLQRLEELVASTPRPAREWLRSVGASVVTRLIEDGDLAGDDDLQDPSLLRHLDDPAALYVLSNSTDVIGDREFYERRAFGPDLQDGPDPASLIRERWSPPDDRSLREAALRWDFLVKLPDDFLLVEDRTSMAHGLESRVPFLDEEMVDLAFTLPLSEKFGDTGDVTAGKSILRRAMRDRLPETVFRKDKQGFTMPTYPFVRDELLDHARSILDDPHVVRAGLVDGSYLRDLLGRQPSRELTPHYKLLWKLVALEIWYQMYVVRDVAGPEPLASYYT